MSEIENAMAAIERNFAAIQESEKQKIVGPPGPRGERGEKGEPPSLQIGNIAVGQTPNVTLRKTENGGYTLDFVLPMAQRGIPGDRGEKGIPGPEPRIRIGSVVSGDDAQVELRRSGDFYELNLTLPCGKDGKDGKSIVGPQGPQGASGRDGKDGESIRGDVGPAGNDGKNGLSEEEIRKIVVSTIIETMQNTGVLTEQARKLVEIKASLRQEIHEVDNRNISELTRYLKRVDKLF